MSVKILIVFVCAAIGTLAGYSVMLRYRRNSAYLEAVCSMIGELKRNISYRRDTVSSVLGAIETDSALLKKNIADYIDFAKGNADKPTIGRGFLNKDVYARVCELFASLGRSDSPAQINELDMFADTFGKLSLAAKQKSDKFGTVAVKLGFLFGVGIGVLVL